MTISQLIKQLEDIKEKHGDVPVNVFEPYALGCGGLFETQARIALDCDDNDNVVGVTLCDEDTRDAFFGAEGG